MSATAITFKIERGMTAEALKFAEEVMGPRRGEHDESRRRLGITAEKMWTENTNQGDMLILYLEGGDLEAAMKGMGEGGSTFDLWFQEKLFALTGVDICDARQFAPTQFLFESPQLVSKRFLRASATVLPVLPGRSDAMVSLLEELAGSRAEEYRAYLWRYGLHLERFFLQQRGEMEAVILYLEGINPAAAIASFARSHQPFDAWLREEMLDINGIDFIRRQTAPPPRLVLDWHTEPAARAA